VTGQHEDSLRRTICRAGTARSAVDASDRLEDGVSDLGVRASSLWMLFTIFSEHLSPTLGRATTAHELKVGNPVSKTEVPAMGTRRVDERSSSSNRCRAAIATNCSCGRTVRPIELLVVAHEVVHECERSVA